MSRQDREQTHEFGANYWVVEEMYRDYLADPNSVSESWREFFSDYTPSWESGSPRAGRASGDGEAAEDSSQGSPGDGQAPGDTTGDGQAPGDTTGDGQASRSQPATGGKQQRSDEQAGDGQLPAEAQLLRGVDKALAEHMNDSRSVPTATSIREVPAKLLEVNRRILNNQLGRVRGGKVSFTHLIGWAMVKAMDEMPVMRQSYAEDEHGKPHVVRPEQLNLGLAMDVQRSDGSRSLLVPNIKNAANTDFAGFFRAYEEVVSKVNNNDLDPHMFAETTATLTNPGTVGTVGSVPRLMPGQSVIVGVGAIDYPTEFKATDPGTLAEIAVGKIITLTSTYDHRVIQGAESGLFLARIHELLTGEDGFYDEIFASLKVPYSPVRWHTDENPRLGGEADHDQANTIIAVQQLIHMYRVRGHLIAKLDPLQHLPQPIHPELDPAHYGLTIWDLDREFPTGGLAGHDRMKLGDVLGLLRDAYCRTLGVEYMYIQDPEQKAWIQNRVEGQTTTLDADEQRHILGRLNVAEAFEKFLGTKFMGQKRFSLEGAESLMPMLDALLSAAADNEVDEAVVGTTHRGRLNILTNILNKPYAKVFREFEGDIDPEPVQGSGDVKYHLGTIGAHTSPAGNEISVHLSGNPSHLEAVDPVVEGMARARQDPREDYHGTEEGPAPVLPVLLHGDAAFAGQGVVAETLAMSQLRGYRTGGTVHLIINNQLGFTTAPHQGRSSQYPTDVAKTVQAPTFHVNGDDPEACVRAVRLALDFRNTFGKDVVVDMVCYRRHGHNEGDEPSFTQPVMYDAIANHRSVRKLYTEELVNRGDLTVDEAEQALDDYRERLDEAFKETEQSEPTPLSLEAVEQGDESKEPPPSDTGVDRDVLDRVAETVNSWPGDFTVHEKLGKMLKKRRDILESDEVDWAMAEQLAFGSLLLEGVPIRLAGQDSRRGTFSQRHAVLVDAENAQEYMPLAHLDSQQAQFFIYDSPLNEFAAMGFEYGYSVSRTEALPLWEAQFGDFVNGAQVVLDQFVTSAEDKWGQTSDLTLLLPHSYEGQGPEHSSARLERFLSACARDNMRVARPTTAAQYFHLLRLQALRPVRKPLAVFVPKSLLRAKHAADQAAAFTSGAWQPVLGESTGVEPSEVTRVLLCCGKLYYELAERRDELSAPVGILRVEQLYPWPAALLRAAIDAYPNAEEVYWVQDEPENMGAWPFAQPRLRELVGDDYRLHRATRGASASPATGSHSIHEAQHERLLTAAFDGVPE
jgi:2-oxoglutarate dehydrogenase E1 component